MLSVPFSACFSVQYRFCFCFHFILCLLILWLHGCLTQACSSLKLASILSWLLAVPILHYCKQYNLQPYRMQQLGGKLLLKVEWFSYSQPSYIQSQTTIVPVLCSELAKQHAIPSGPSVGRSPPHRQEKYGMRASAPSCPFPPWSRTYRPGESYQAAWWQVATTTVSQLNLQSAQKTLVYYDDQA